MEGPKESRRYSNDAPEEYEVSYLTSLPKEYLLPLLIKLSYRDLIKLRRVSRKFRDIIDTDYFWKLKTQRDFNVEYDYPRRRGLVVTAFGVKETGSLSKNWKDEYIVFVHELKSEFIEAVREGNVVRVRELLDFGINPDTQSDVSSDYRATALMLAAKNGHPEIVEILLAAGAVNFEGINWETPLIFASIEGHVEIIDLLLAAGADINHPSKYLGTALIAASRFNQPEAVNRLLAAGADVNIFDFMAKTALDWARERGNTEIEEMLRAAGGKLKREK